MESEVLAGATPAPTNESAFGRSDPGTQYMLGAGVIVGPFYLAVGLIQALVRDGFDPARHPLSVLANGPGGWVQVANLAICGLMVIAAAIGIQRVIRPQSRAASWLLGAFGDNLFFEQPEVYPSGYYRPSALHALAFVGVEVALRAERSLVRRHGLFFEAVTINQYLDAVLQNRSMRLLSAFSSSFGYRAML